MASGKDEKNSLNFRFPRKLTLERMNPQRNAVVGDNICQFFFFLSLKTEKLVLFCVCVCFIFIPTKKKKKDAKKKKNGGFSRLRKFLFFFFFSYFLLLEGLGEDNFFFFSSVVSMDPTLFVVIRTNLLGIIIIGVVESSKQCSFFFSFFLSWTWSFCSCQTKFFLLDQ